MTWKNTLRRFFGRVEHPPAITGATSILFCLQDKSPMTLEELNAATHIPFSDLRRVLDALALTNRIRSEAYNKPDFDRQYWLVPVHNEGDPEP